MWLCCLYGFTMQLTPIPTTSLAGFVVSLYLICIQSTMSTSGYYASAKDKGLHFFMNNVQYKCNKLYKCNA